MTTPARSRAGGASLTHGALSSKSKYTAPVNRTARSTSERTSVFTRETSPADERHNQPDGRTSTGAARRRNVRIRRRNHAPAASKGQCMSSSRANELATRLEQGAVALASLASGLSDVEWGTKVPHDGRPIGVV